MSLEEQLKQLKRDQDAPKWPSELDAQFAQKLKKELHKPAKKRTVLWYYAAAAVILLAVVANQLWFGGQEIDPAQQQMLEQIAAAEYPSQQLEAMAEYQATTDNKADADFQKVLIELLGEQTQTNVKIEAISALKPFGNEPPVRQALLDALERETEALVQIKLIKTLAELKETRATDPLEQIIADRNQEAAVRNTATLAVASFNNQ